MHNKKGLSDVVTTVLIILLAVAAVSAIWLLIKPLIENSASTVQKTQACYGTSVELVSCTKSNPVTLENTTEEAGVEGDETYVRNGHNVIYKLSTIDTAQVKSISKVNLGVIYNDGSVANNGTNSLSISDVGVLKTAQFNVTKDAKEVTLVSEFVLEGDQKQSCTSAKITCSN